MDIKQTLRKALLEGKHKKTTHKNEYGCLMVNLEIDQKDWDKLSSIIKDEDLYQPEDDPTYGRETEPHVTVLFGLHGDIPDADIEKQIAKMKKPELSFKGISAFKNELFEVLKFDVESEDMHKLNKEFRKFPHTTSYPNYHPHCTIAYVKPNMADKYIKKLNELKDIKSTVSDIVYSKVDGTKKTYDFQ